MQVKTFEAITMKEAVKAVKTEFGNDAVILNTKEKPAGHSQAGRVFEVTAAIMDQPKEPGASFNTIDKESLEHLTDKIDTIDLKLSSISDNIVRRTQLNTLEAGLDELKIFLIESLRAKDHLNLKNLPKSFETTYQKLKFMGIDECYLSNLIDYLADLPSPEKAGKAIPEDTKEYYRSHAIRWMLKRIKIAPRWENTSLDCSLHCFVGPTGTGKTSLIAKLGANLRKRDKANVLFVSHDFSRVGSTEQLRIYSKMLDSPFVTIDRISELSAILDKHKDADYVLIDTAGRSPKNPGNLRELLDLKEYPHPIDTHLVLSVTEKETQLDRAIRSFATLGISSLIFSKLDESWSYGEIFNLGQKWGLPLSYFSIGQNVPDDIERATRERVVERIFGL